MSTKPRQKKELAVPRPSSRHGYVVLISPQNEVLLLHRVKTSTSYASAHVFPGGNISPLHDGEYAFDKEDPRRHYDAPNYRNAAIRELFEESGILLAKDKQDSLSGLFHVNDAEREQGRRDIHSNKIGFSEWLRKQHATAEPDIDGLIPFTHWITPTNLPKRFTTQMYLYFLPIPTKEHSAQNTATTTAQGLPKDGRQEVQVPTSDGGIEINEARFLPASTWLQKARAGEIILYPPQYLLLSIVSQFLDQTAPHQGPNSTVEELIEEEEKERHSRRNNLLQFILTDNPPWTDKFVCPKTMKLLDDKRSVLALDEPGPELHGSGKKGVFDRVILVRFDKDGPHDVDVCWRKDVLGDLKSAL
ncbi:hypothetical protein UA08_00074 [Talaromyces atroroseus]|uniref:Nudix hydrolase domain-containing protein n=1 Tax=Talaromyces atroroseus TaxID=1441469 RepID=A0A225B692_TALAT|nr:hypothetical protein UA08_00074 [Talaromyces atroroseus]OKL63649.1 hypothetical protein UA08_00074 [Talaromyces atroroseus]